MQPRNYSDDTNRLIGKMMDFNRRYAVNEKNETYRRENGKVSFEMVLNGAEIDDLKINVYPCECGHYPFIGKPDNNGNCDVYCKGCNTTYNFKGSYSGAIFRWNCQKNVPIDLKSFKLHPFLAIEITDPMDVIKKATKRSKSDIHTLSGTRSRTEKKLIRLLMLWNNYALNLKRLYESHPDKFKRT